MITYVGWIEAWPWQRKRLHALGVRGPMYYQWPWQRPVSKTVMGSRDCDTISDVISRVWFNLWHAVVSCILAVFRKGNFEHCHCRHEIVIRLMSQFPGFGGG